MTRVVGLGLDEDVVGEDDDEDEEVVVVVVVLFCEVAMTNPPMTMTITTITITTETTLLMPFLFCLQLSNREAAIDGLRLAIVLKRLWSK